MTDKVQKIREEIERLKEETSIGLSEHENGVEQGRMEIINALSLFLDSMQEESVSKNMETDIAIRLGSACHKQVWNENQFSKEDCKAYCSLYKECQECSLDFCMIFFHDPHCHFEEEPLSEDLEEAANNYVDEFYASLGTTQEEFPTDAEISKKDFKAGAKWQITKLTKDATDVTVHIDAGGYPYTPEIELYDYDKDVPLAKEGDKYKVVLIKEE